MSALIMLYYQACKSIQSWWHHISYVLPKHGSPLNINFNASKMIIQMYTHKRWCVLTCVPKHFQPIQHQTFTVLHLHWGKWRWKTLRKWRNWEKWRWRTWNCKGKKVNYSHQQTLTYKSIQTLYTYLPSLSPLISSSHWKLDFTWIH